ncbi:hypothetical protein JHL18_01115 [Clostridium sp. YIM B02505]|uniref:Uncharacterized protein n=1 Tax=Clostridium yunnanense TaxID=2800325 RepID=A0ABS1EIQ6_9CLOT|nr:hypothetical protein [Clostridium yunnanense]MBK1809246.1 hypothetical protein [Clostridium yunnanense]
MNKKLNLYYFGDIGDYDKSNPDYICNKPHVSEILYILALNNPFALEKKQISEQLNINEEYLDEIINNLKNIEAITVKGNTFKLNFPVFLEKDIPLLDRYFSSAGKPIGDIVINCLPLIAPLLKELSSYGHFTNERLLYHIICDSIFDGTAFDFFIQKDLFTESKPQPGNRNYMIFAYEDSDIVETHSNLILCSSNNYSGNKYTFNSFGDSNGTRKDMYRFFRKLITAIEPATEFKELNMAYINILEEKNKELVDLCGDLIIAAKDTVISYKNLSPKEKVLIDFLIELEYLSVDEQNSDIYCLTPIFNCNDLQIIDQISNIILDNIADAVTDLIDKFNEAISDFTPIRHGISIKEISIELWHQIFGFTNEYLSKVLLKIHFIEKDKVVI